MQLLTQEETNRVSGALTINLGMVLAGMALGFVTGGPAGLGAALCVAVAAEGLNKTQAMVNAELQSQYNGQLPWWMRQ